jgi:hypothetical protein
MNLKNIKNNIKDQITFSRSYNSDIPIPNIKEVMMSVSKHIIEIVKKLISSRS